MRRFVTFFLLLAVAAPFGLSISGCGKKDSVTYCSPTGGGLQVGQLNTLLLQPVIYGISLNYGQIGQLSAPTASDCKGSPVSVSSFTYASDNLSVVDVNPSTGALCAGTWNRNTNVIPDYTVCTPPTSPDPKGGVAYVTASAGTVSSNRIPVYVHPVVTSVLLGTTGTTSSSGTSNCTTDPTTQCCPLAANNSITAPPYDENSCVSQGHTAQLVARVFSGTGTYDPATGTTTGTLQNISCTAGHLTFAAQTSGLVSIDENGVATAEQPGSTLVTATVANAGSSAGVFSTCPPASIQLSVPNSSSSSVTVGQNFTQPLTATVLDTNGVTLSGLSLEYVSTTPTTIPAASGGTVTPAFPGAASITAICQPPSCNPAPFNQIGRFGNGKPVTSGAIDVTTPGTNSTLLYIASTNSRYMVPVDFTTNSLGAPVQLPFDPNSMVISQDGTSIYMGSTTELMVLSATTNGLTSENRNVPGYVLAVSPDNSEVVIADPTKKLIYIASTTTSSGSSSGTGSGSGTTGTGSGTIGVTTQYGWSGVGMPHAAFSPDSQTVYVTDPGAGTSGNSLLTYSLFTGWSATKLSDSPLDVAVTVPSIGAYFAGAHTTAIGYCASTTTTTSNGNTVTTNVFNPQADDVSTATDRIAATNDGQHILGANASGVLSDIRVKLPVTQQGVACPAGEGSALQFGSATSPTQFTTTALSGITPTTITGVVPSSDSSVAAVTFTGTGGVLPVYAPVANSTSAVPGTLTNVPLTNGATAPVAAVWSTDDLTLFVGTSGDNQVHLVTRSSTTTALKDTKTIAPDLPLDPNSGATGTIAVPNLLVEKPRPTT